MKKESKLLGLLLATIATIATAECYKISIADRYGEYGEYCIETRGPEPENILLTCENGYTPEGESSFGCWSASWIATTCEDYYDEPNSYYCVYYEETYNVTFRKDNCQGYFVANGICFCNTVDPNGAANVQWIMMGATGTEEPEICPPNS